MSTPTETTRGLELADGKYLAGAVGGAAGALVMGGLMLAMNDAVLAVAIPSLYTLAPPPNPAVGMAVHVFHGTVLGLAFAGGVTALDLDSPGTVVAAGLGWGAVTWVLLAALVMPVWLGAVGSPASPPLPNFAPPSLLWHLVYGGVLAGVYVAVGGRR